MTACGAKNAPSKRLYQRHEREPGEGSAISGMTLFLKTYGSDMDDRAFAARLSAVDPAEILRRSKTDFSTNNRALRCARVLLKKYNSARGGKKLSYHFQG